MDEREKNLPKWAQELIVTLRSRVGSATQPLIRELAQLRSQVSLLKNRLNGMEELLQCAAKGGHITAQEIIDVLAGYELVLAKENVI